MGGRKRFDVQWSEPAASDLDEIVGFIAQDRPSVARQVLDRIRKAASALESSPLRGRIVPELKEQGIRLYRELVVPPWRVIYRPHRDRVFVLAVVDSRRRLEDVLLDRLTRRP